jgi:hypothetical protein
MNEDIAAVRHYANAQLEGCKRCEQSGLGDLVASDKVRWTTILTALDALEYERARNKAETCSCCGGKLWNCCCTAGINADGTMHTCWGTHGPSLKLNEVGKTR